MSEREEEDLDVASELGAEPLDASDPPLLK